MKKYFPGDFNTILTPIEIFCLLSILNYKFKLNELMICYCILLYINEYIVVFGRNINQCICLVNI